MSFALFLKAEKSMKINVSWRIQDAFNWMPLVGLIGGRILCMHGGISPQIQNIDQLRQLHRPQDPPNPSIGIDLLWLESMKEGHL